MISHHEASDHHPPARKKTTRSLISFSTFHFLDDGFSDALYLLLPFITAELNLSFSQVGLLRGIFTGTMSLFQFPLSLLGERIGEMTVIATGTIGLGVGFLLLSRAHTFLGILLSLILSKCFSAGQHGLSSSILSRVFEASRRRAAMGTYNFSGDIGKVCFPFVLTLLINLWGWRQATLALALGGAAAGAILWGLAREAEQEPSSPPSGAGTSEKKGWGIGDRKSFLALLTIGVLDSSTRAALLTFLPFLLLQKGIPTAQLGFGLTLLFAGGAFGKLACGILAERIGVIPMVVGTEVLTAAGIVSLMAAPTPLTWVLLPVLGIMLNGTSSVLYATVAEIISPTARSRGYGLYYAITLGSAAAAPLVYGLLTDALGLSVAIPMTALMVLLTLPLSPHLKKRPERPIS